MNFSWKIDENSLREIQSSLKKFDATVKKEIIRSAGRSWAKGVVSQMRNNMTWKETDLKKAVKVKVKTLRKNRGVWIGVGIESGKKLGEGGFDSYWAATKARWYNDGWTAYPKGRKSGRKGKGWRLGLRKQGGTKVWETHFLEKTASQTLPLLPSYIIEAVERAISTQGKS